MGIDLRSSVALSLKCAAAGQTAADLDVEPCLSGDRGSPNHLENFVLRKLLVNWFISPMSNLDLEVEGGGSVSYETTEDGRVVINNRPMTRADIVVLETRFHTQGDIDMSPQPEARIRRNAMAEAYMRRMSMNGECGSTPMLIAFVHLSKTPCGIRIYQRHGRGLKAYADIVSPTYAGLPSESEDDILALGFDAPLHVDASMSDDCAWTEADAPEPESESEYEPESDGAESEPEPEAEDQLKTPPTEQNFIRLLFSAPSGMSRAAGHYDLLATSFQQNIITTIFPDTGTEFSAL